MRLKTTFFICAYLIFFLLSGCSKPPTITKTSNSDLKPGNPPYQKKYNHTNKNFVKSLSKGTCTIKPLYEYKVLARVVAKKNYHSGWQGEVAPCDLALAWEKLAKPEYHNCVSFSQRNRWYYFRLKSGAPFDLDFVYKRSSNNHIIPHNENILRALKKIRKNDMVYIQGYLVRADGTWGNGTRWWNSSTSRDDRGDGSCEVIYATSIQIGKNIYK